MAESVLNIQEISSRTWVEPNMDSSIDHPEHNTSLHRHLHPNPTTFSRKEPPTPSPTQSHTHPQQLEELTKLQEGEVEEWKRRANAYAAQLEAAGKKGSQNEWEGMLGEMRRRLEQKDQYYDSLRHKYSNAIFTVKDMLGKNELLTREIERLSHKLRQSELNYSRDRDNFNRSQHIISNLSVTKSSYEIELVNMQDSLVIMEKEKREAEQSRDNYEEKLALLSQECERLRMVMEKVRKELQGESTARQRCQAENRDLKQALERSEKTEQLLTGKLGEYTQQLRVYHQRLSGKQSAIGEYREKETALESTIRVREEEVQELRERVEQMEQSSRLTHQDHLQQLQESTQEVARLREIARQLNSKHLQLLGEKDRMQGEYDQLLGHYQKLKEKHQELIGQWQAEKVRGEELGEMRRQLMGERQEKIEALEKLEKEREEWGRERERWQRRGRSLEEELRRVGEEEERMRQAGQGERRAREATQVQMEEQQEQHNQQLISRINQLNQLKYQLSASTTHLSQLQQQLAQITSDNDHLSNQLTAARQQVISLSTAIDSSRKHYEDQLKLKHSTIYQLQSRLANTEKILQQARREKDLLVQDKKEILTRTHKSEQIIQAKEGEVEARVYHIKQLETQLLELRGTAQKREAELKGSQRVIIDHEQVVKALEAKISDGGYRVIQLTNELARLGDLNKEKEKRLEESEKREDEMRRALEDRKMEAVALQQNLELLGGEMRRRQQNHNSFKVLMAEIERLNLQVAGKQSKNQALREEVVGLVRRIERIGQEQNRILEILHTSEQNYSRRDGVLSEGLSQIREAITRSNQSSLAAIHQSAQQNQLVWKELEGHHQDERAASTRLQRELAEANSLLLQRSRELAVAGAQRDSLRIRFQEVKGGAVQQEEVLEKLLQMSSENARLREEVVGLRGHLERLSQAKDYQLQQTVNSFSGEMGEVRRQVDVLRVELEQRDILVAQLREKLEEVGRELTQKLTHIQNIERIISQNSQQLGQYRQVLARRHQDSPPLRMQQEEEIGKLQAILHLKTQQLAENEESYNRLKARKKELEREVKRMQGRVSELETMLEKEKGQERVGEWQESTATLQEQIKDIHFKLQQGEQKLQAAQAHNQQLQMNFKLMERENSRLNEQVQRFEGITQEFKDTGGKVGRMEEALETKIAELNQLRIDHEYMKESEARHLATLTSYELKYAQLVSQQEKLQHILSGLRETNSSLESKNHFLEGQLKKAKALQEKIQVLSREVSRLSAENIDLNEELSGCRLSMGEGTTMERRFEEQMAAMVMLMAEVESLRNQR